MTLEQLKKEYTEEELQLAFEAIHDNDLAEKLLKENSRLVDFTMDMKLQDILFKYFEK